MRLLNYRELRRRYELDGAAKTVEHLSEALTERSLRPEDFSLRDLAEALIPDGREWVRTLDPRSGGVTPVLEASEGVDASAFQNITAQVIHARILESYQQEAFVASRLVDTIPTRLDGEKIPGVSRVADQVDEVQPGMPYPSLGFDEDYIETPATTKHGFIVPVTASASNLGGASDEMFSAAQVVLPASRPAIAEAGQVRVAGATAGGVKSVAGAAAGLVLPRETIVAA